MAKQKREDWLQERRKGIGSSDASAIMGVSPWKTRRHVQLEKLEGVADEKESELLRLGQLMEPVILALYEDRFKEKPRRVNQIVYSKQWPWMLASLDAKIGGNRPFEAKMVVFPHGNWGEENTDDIPVQYVIQTQHQMAVTGAELVEVPVIMFGKLKMYRVQRNAELIGIIVDKEQEFWNKHILEKIPVDPEFDHPSTLELFNSIYPIETKTVDLTDQALEVVTKYQGLGQLVSQGITARDSLKAEILSMLGDAEWGFLPDGNIVHRKMINRKGFEVAPTTFPKLSIEKPKEARND